MNKIKFINLLRIVVISEGCSENGYPDLIEFSENGYQRKGI